MNQAVVHMNIGKSWSNRSSIDGPGETLQVKAGGTLKGHSTADFIEGNDTVKDKMIQEERACSF